MEEIEITRRTFSDLEEQIQSGMIEDPSFIAYSLMLSALHDDQRRPFLMLKAAFEIYKLLPSKRTKNHAADHLKKVQIAFLLARAFRCGVARCQEPTYEAFAKELGVSIRLVKNVAEQMVPTDPSILAPDPCGDEDAIEFRRIIDDYHAKN
jgi:hypothetical protein